MNGLHVGKAKTVHRFCQEVDPFVQRIHQSDLQGRKSDGQRKSREAGSCPYIDQSHPVHNFIFFQYSRDGKTVQEMFYIDFFKIHDGR